MITKSLESPISELNANNEHLIKNTLDLARSAIGLLLDIGYDIQTIRLGNSLQGLKNGHFSDNQQLMANVVNSLDNVSLETYEFYNDFFIKTIIKISHQDVVPTISAHQMTSDGVVSGVERHYRRGQSDNSLTFNSINRLVAKVSRLQRSYPEEDGR